MNDNVDFCNYVQPIVNGCAGFIKTDGYMTHIPGTIIMMSSDETCCAIIHIPVIYNIYITNKVPDKTAKISVFLVDNDNDIMTPFPYAYRIVYTNLEHTDTTITNIAELDFYQSVATFEIPSTGEAAEATY